MLNFSVGEDAPDFKLPLAQGGEFHLGSVTRSGPILINFIRGTWCDFCSNHLSKMR